jgi:hypothetical protein
MHPDVDGYLPCPDVGSMRLNQAAGPKLIDQDQRADCRGGEPGGANGWDNHSVATSDPLDEELTHRRTAAGENRHPPSVAVLVAVAARRPVRHPDHRVGARSPSGSQYLSTTSRSP